MNTSALVLMLSTMFLVVGMTSCFFLKVLTSPQISGPDSYEDMDVEGEQGTRA